MPPFTVHFQPAARADISRVVAWLERNGQRAFAARWRSGLLTDVVGKLETDPKRYPAADEAPDLGFDLRCLAYGRKRHIYRVLFTIDGNEVNILRIRHAAQDTLTGDDL